MLPIPKEQSLEGVDRLWFVRSSGITFEYQPNTERLVAWLEKNWRAQSRQCFDGLSVTLYERGPSLNNPDAPDVVEVDEE